MRLRTLLRYKLDELLGRFGYLRCLDGWNTPFDISEDDKLAMHAVEEFTMTSLDRRYHLRQAVRHVVIYQIPGIHRRMRRLAWRQWNLDRAPYLLPPDIRATRGLLHVPA
jgi:hypothetical protein